MIHAFIFFTPNSDPTSECHIRLIRPGNVFSIFYCPVLVSLCELYPPCAVLIWQERHPAWSSAAGAHLLQGSMCCVFRDGILYSCVFRDGILHTLVVTSGYLRYCCLSIISNQSAHSPLTSDINKAFSSMVVCENPSRSAVLTMTLLKIRLHLHNVLYDMKDDFLFVENCKSHKNDFSCVFTERVTHTHTQIYIYIYVYFI